MTVVTNMIELHIVKRMKSGFRFLLLKRSANEVYPGIWQMVSGGIEKNEKAFETAKRELKEETGLSPTKMWVVPKVNSFYNPRVDSVSLIPVFLVLVDSDASVTLSVEHNEFIWTTGNRAKSLLAWPGQREVVDIITLYLTKRENYLKFVELPLI